MLTVDPHPRGLRYLYAAVAGHALAWYSLYNLFVFWLVSRGASDAAANTAYGDLVAAAYLLPLLGGVVASGYASRVGLGPRRTAILGGFVAIVGYILTTASALHHVPPGYAVALVALGVGLSKPNLSALVGRMFPIGSSHADAAFARYYSFLNAGSLGAPLLGGWLSTTYGFAAAFAVAIAGELLVVAALLSGRRHLAVAESPSSLQTLVGLDVELPGTLQADHVGVDVDPRIARDMAAAKRRKLVALWIFFALAALSFWPAYSQNGSGLNLWALRHTDRVVLNYNVPAAWFAAINSIVCIVASVPLVGLFTRLRIALSTSTFVGYVLMAASFGTLLLAPVQAAQPGYLVVAIVLSSLAEVLISTIGLAQVAKLAPRHQTSTYMAVWFVTVACGGKLAGLLGSRLELRVGFGVLTVAALLAGAVTLLLRRWLDVAVRAPGAASEALSSSEAAFAMAAPPRGLLALPTHSGEVVS